MHTCHCILRLEFLKCFIANLIGLMVVSKGGDLYEVKSRRLDLTIERVSPLVSGTSSVLLKIVQTWLLNVPNVLMIKDQSKFIKMTTHIAYVGINSILLMNRWTSSYYVLYI